MNFAFPRHLIAEHNVMSTSVLEINTRAALILAIHFTK